MSCCGDFWAFVIGGLLLWWLFAAFVLSRVWNRVVTQILPAKPMTFGQAIFLIFGLTILFAPHHVQSNWKGDCRASRTLNLTQHPANPTP